MGWLKLLALPLFIKVDTIWVDKVSGMHITSKMVVDLDLSVNLMTSQTTVNWISLKPLKNSCSLILAAMLMADLPLGTSQFSMSQNTPRGRWSPIIYLQQ